MPTRDLSQVSPAQLSLIEVADGRAVMQRLPHTLDQVRILADEVAALDLSIRCSGMQAKDIASKLKINEGNWSKIVKGLRGWPKGKRHQFMDVVGNEILLEWDIERRGKDASTLRPHRSNLERENELLRQQLADQDRALRLVVDHAGRLAR